MMVIVVRMRMCMAARIAMRVGMSCMIVGHPAHLVAARPKCK
jgi:hypothetical protein